MSCCSYSRRAVRTWSAEPRRSPARAATGGRCGKAGVGAFLDEITFELRQRGEHVEDEPSAARGGVDGLLQGPEPNPAIRESVELVDEVSDGATEPVEPPDDEGVSRANLVDELVELGAVLEGPGHGVDKHSKAAGRIERVDLQRRVLIGGGHARVPEEVPPATNVAKLGQRG